LVGGVDVEIESLGVGQLPGRRNKVGRCGEAVGRVFLDRELWCVCCWHMQLIWYIYLYLYLRLAGGPVRVPEDVVSGGRNNGTKVGRAFLDRAGGLAAGCVSMILALVLGRVGGTDTVGVREIHDEFD
jgi:hypothetical protein